MWLLDFFACGLFFFPFFFFIIKQAHTRSFQLSPLQTLVYPFPYVRDTKEQEQSGNILYF